jgi:ELWxxDGT repeat protein
VSAAGSSFAADDGVHGTEIWKSDGTRAGTKLVEDIVSGARSRYIGPLKAAGGRLFFVAHDRVHGGELWSSDGTEARTNLVKDIYPGGTESYPERTSIRAARSRIRSTSRTWTAFSSSLPGIPSTETSSGRPLHDGTTRCR